MTASYKKSNITRNAMSAIILNEKSTVTVKISWRIVNTSSFKVNINKNKTTTLQKTATPSRQSSFKVVWRIILRYVLHIKYDNNVENVDNKSTCINSPGTTDRRAM